MQKSFIFSLDASANTYCVFCLGRLEPEVPPCGTASGYCRHGHDGRVDSLKSRIFARKPFWRIVHISRQ